MLATFQALVVLVVSVLPGALFTFEYERECGRLAISDFNERLIAFVGMSAFFGLVSMPLLYQGYRSWVVTGALRRGEPLPWWLWLIVVAYVVVPLGTGLLAGFLVRNRVRWAARVLTGPSPHPRAWDALFRTPGLGGYLKLRLKEPGVGNPWIMGAWAAQDAMGGGGDGVRGRYSYASAYPHDQDLYLMETFEIDSEGRYITDGEDGGRPVARGQGVLVRWDEVLYAEFIEA